MSDRKLSRAVALPGGQSVVVMRWPLAVVVARQVVTNILAGLCQVPIAHGR